MEPIYFKSAAELRLWFEENHKTKKELFVGYFRKSTGKKTITWSESVDEALCFGWIDGRINPIDDERYTRRFTPRKPDSIWSNVNLKKVEQLIKDGRMRSEGLASFERRKADKSGIYHFENPPTTLDPKLEEIFKRNEKSWNFFTKQAPSYQKLMFHWIMSGKKDETRVRRMNQLISASADGVKL